MLKKVCFSVILGMAMIFATGNNSAIAANQRSPGGWLTFSYPDNWELNQTELTRTRYVENFMLQPRGQDFSGRPGQVILRVFDPFYVVEESRIFSFSGNEQTFRAFVKSLPGESGATFSTEKIGGINVFVARSSGSGLPTVYFGGFTSEGFPVVVGAAGTTTSNTYHDQILINVFQSVRFSPANGQSAIPANSVASWYGAISRGDARTLAGLSCANARALFGLVGAFSGLNRSTGIMGAIVSAGRTFDYSRLRFSTYESNEKFAVVRISGLVRRPDGIVEPFHRYASAFGSNMLAVNKEASGWKVCEAVRAR